MSYLSPEDVDSILENADDLPALPAVAIKVLETLSTDDYTAKDVSRLLTQDQTLSLRVLAVANSSYFRGRGQSEVTDLTAAVARLGAQQIRAILLANTAFQAVDHANPPIDDFDLTAFKKHSVATAGAALMLAENAGHRPGDDAFIAGLLHGIGVVVLDQFAGIAMVDLQESVRDYDATLLEAEREILGMDHGFIGSRLLHRWSIPRTIVSAVYYATAPSTALDGPERVVASAVHVTHVMAHMLRMGNPGYQIFGQIEEGALDALKLDGPQLKMLIPSVHRAMQDAEVFFAME